MIHDGNMKHRTMPHSLHDIILQLLVVSTKSFIAHAIQIYGQYALFISPTLQLHPYNFLFSCLALQVNPLPLQFQRFLFETNLVLMLQLLYDNELVISACPSS
jgi:hypothetical protein